MTLHVGLRNQVEECLDGYEVAGETLHLIGEKSATILDTLAEGRRRIREFFGADATARLSLKKDPEIPGAESVVVEIVVPGNAENALERMERFDFGWWLAASRREIADICFLALPR